MTMTCLTGPIRIVHEGSTCWGACQRDLFDALKRLGWRTEAQRAEPPEHLSFDAAYAALCNAVPPRQTMTREAMQPPKGGPLSRRR